MRVLITGGAGFIGSYLAEHYLKNGHSVTIIDNLTTGRRENIAPFSVYGSLFEFIHDSVVNILALEPLVEKCDYCFHLASPVGVKYIMKNPLLTVLDNLRGIDKVLELTDKYKKRVLIASTSEVYGRNLDLLDPTHTRKLTEEDYRVEGSTQNHRWAYANAKSMNEFLALAYYKERQTETMVVRFFNTVGGRQAANFGMVIPNFVQRALENQNLIVYGEGKQCRSFIHISDVVRAISQLIESPKALGQVFNLGNPEEITMLELAKKIITLTNSHSQIEFQTYQQAYGLGFEDMMRRTGDITKISQLLNFQLEYKLEDSLLEIINYQKKLRE